VHDAVDLVRQEVDPEANIIFGATLDDALTGKIRVSVVASGMHRAEPANRPAAPSAQPHGSHGLRARSPAAPRAEAGSGHAGAQPPKQPARREERHAPGEVVIREKPPQLPGSLPQPGYGRAGGRKGNGEAEKLPDHGERQDGRHGERTRRPMPSVEDFPLVGQREYWAKAGGGAGRVEPQPPDPPQRKTGLFQRLTGGGREKRVDSGQPTERTSDEPLDLPVFFRRDQGA
jgi:cell division protein FtsZ